MKLIVLIILFCGPIISTAQISHNHRVKYNIKEEVKELLMCKCIDYHIEELVKRQVDSTSKFESPLLLGKLINNGVFNSFRHDSLLSLVRVYSILKVEPELKRFQEHEEDYLSYSNLLNWCKSRSQEFTDTQWLFIKKKYLKSALNK